MRDSRFSSSASEKEWPSILRLSLTALALIAGGLFVMMQDDSWAQSPQKPAAAASLAAP